MRASLCATAGLAGSAECRVQWRVRALWDVVCKDVGCSTHGARLAVSAESDRQTVIIGTETRDPHYAISRRSAPLTHAHGGACQQSSPVGRALLLLTLSVAHPSHAPYGSRDSRGVCVRGTRE